MTAGKGAKAAPAAADAATRDQIGKRTRGVAEEKFDPHRITRAFESVIVDLAKAAR